MSISYIKPTVLDGLIYLIITLICSEVPFKIKFILGFLYRGIHYKISGNKCMIFTLFTQMILLA